MFQNKIKLFFLILFFIIALKSTGQSTSVFDANYFNTDNSEPSLRIGKGFHINDIYKQTKNCFRIESINQKNLTSQQVGGKKTSIKLFYTKNTREYNNFKSKGNSGSVSFLNLFEFEGKKLEEFTSSTNEEEERLIFTANVDFGIFSFEKEPILTDECKNLIAQNKLQSFVNLYGTHYISGIKKESSITVILKKNESSNFKNYKIDSSIKSNGNIPTKGKGSFEIINNDWVNSKINQYNFTVTVEVNGPTLDQYSIQKNITDILSSNQISDKANAISNIISDAIKNISDPTQSNITQYYYSPFSLYGLEGINWDLKKQKELIKLNEVLINIYQVKSFTNLILEKISIDEIENNLIRKDATNQTIDLVKNKYYKTIQNLKNHVNDIDLNINEIEQKYKLCADIYCNQITDCCNNSTLIENINKKNYENNVNQEITNYLNFILDVNNELNKPECEKKQQGIIKIQNLSSNPYDLYNGNKYLGIIEGKSSLTFYVNNGQYKFKAVQRSGYLVYATENIRNATINKVCQEITLNIGY